MGLLKNCARNKWRKAVNNGSGSGFNAFACDNLVTILPGNRTILGYSGAVACGCNSLKLLVDVAKCELALNVSTGLRTGASGLLRRIGFTKYGTLILERIAIACMVVGGSPTVRPIITKFLREMRRLTEETQRSGDPRSICQNHGASFHITCQLILKVWMQSPPERQR